MAPPAVSASVDLTADDPPFNPADFVGSKKKYPSSDTPAAIQAALDAVLKLPAAMLPSFLGRTYLLRMIRHLGLAPLGYETQDYEAKELDLGEEDTTQDF
ncbi:hypothetical protein GGX14DRAFT_564924 [Mycena pura]|uniref:Uncharacterized protein n=1 Tax=Mycena pura TaxID=153505 RepID=A0AAD6YI78_9AGAR|nr:hypothetical protein GGX14DRAFT_564924 [Mycena pura]